MSQEPTLFNCSIAENISYGLKDKVTPDDIERVSVSPSYYLAFNFMLLLIQSENCVSAHYQSSVRGCIINFTSFEGESRCNPAILK